MFHMLYVIFIKKQLFEISLKIDIYCYFNIKNKQTVA